MPQKFKEHGKTIFGLFVAETCNEHGITPKQFRDYAGYEQRSFQRMMSGATRLTCEDFLWIVDSIAEMTDQKNGDLYDLILPQMTDITRGENVKKIR